MAPIPWSPKISECHLRTCRSVGFASQHGGFQRNNTFAEEGAVYQFGVAGGKTLRSLLAIYNRTTWGFDTCVRSL